jgi:hypothetical protein
MNSKLAGAYGDELTSRYSDDDIGFGFHQMKNQILEFDSVCAANPQCVEKSH